jgi:tape measure domain-containing protein
MPRKSNTDYTVEIPVVIKDQTSKGARSAENTTQKMIENTRRAAEREEKATEAARMKLADDSLRRFQKTEQEKTKALQKESAERRKIEQDQMRAVESLNRQRSAALLAQWNREQQQFARNEQAKVRAAQQAAAKYEADQDAMWGRLRMLAVAGIAAIALVIAGLSVAVDRAASFQRLEQGLASIMGSAGAATKEIEKLKEVAKVPGLGFREAIQGSLQLQALGVQAERARRIIEAFGNAVAFTGGKAELDRILLQLTQMMSAGRVITQDLRPIIQTAPIAGRALRDAFGTIEPAKLQKMTGNIDEFVDKWVAAMEKLPKAPNAAANAMENLDDTWDRFLISVGKPFLPAMSTALEALTKVLETTGSGFNTILTSLLKYPEVLGAATAAMIAFGAALLFASTNAIPLIIANITSAIQFFIQFGATVKLVGQVMMGTAGLIQGAAATTAVAAAGWIALALAVGGLIYWLTKQRDIQEQLNDITMATIEENSSAYQSNLQLSKAVNETVIAQQDSAKKHEALNAILEQLDPTTRAYIDALITEEEKVRALNNQLEVNISLNKGILEAQFGVAAAGIQKQLNEALLIQDVIEGFNKRIREKQQILQIAQPGEAEGLRKEIFDLSNAVVEWNGKLLKVNETLSENEAKLLSASKGLGHNREQFIQAASQYGITGERLNMLTSIYDKLTHNTNKSTDALHDQADAIGDVKKQLDNLLATGTLEIDTKILEIVKSAKNEAEARKMAQDALKGKQAYFGGRFGGTGLDTRLRDLIEERKRITEVEKAAREVLEPKPISKATAAKGERDAEMVRSMRVVSDELAEDFKEEFGRAMKFHFGQTALHTKLNYRHDAAFDISEDARTREGQFIMQWLDTHGVNFRASLGKEVSKTTGKLISTGVHIHAGELSGPLSRALKVNEGLLSPKGLTKELERQQLVFAPWSGQMVTQEEYTKQRAQLNKAGMVLSTSGAMVSQQEAAQQEAPILAQLPLELERKWDVYYKHIEDNEKSLAERRADFAAEHKLRQSDLITELGHLELDLEHFRKEAQDDQFTQQRRLLDSRREELDLLKGIQQQETDIANGPINESLRIQLALLQDINSIRRRDEEAIKDYNRAQIEMADATVYHAQQADTAVAKFLAGQKSVTEIVADAKIGVMETTFDLMDRGITKITSKLGIMKDLVHDILSSFIKLALSQFFRSVFLGQRGSQGGGGGGGLFSIGGGGIGGGQSGISGIPGVITNLLGGGAGIGVPASVSGGGFLGGFSIPGVGGAHEVGHTIGGAGGAGGLLSSLGAMLPFLGAGLGAQAGGQSRFGSILGGTGGLLAGGIGAALLAPSLFATTGILGSMGPAIAGLLTNPFTAIAAGGLILGAILLGRNAEKRKNETAREALSQEVIAALQGMLSEAEAGNLSPSAAVSQFEELRSRYFSSIAGYDSKTKRIATDWWNKPEHPPQVMWKKIQEAAKAGEASVNIRARMSPVFASGGVSSKSQLIKVRPGEGIRYPGSNTVHTVFGKDLGYDSEYMYAPKGTRIINQTDMRSAKPMQTGGIVGQSGNGELPELVIESLEISWDADGMAKVVISSPHFKKAVIKNVKIGKKERKLA